MAQADWLSRLLAMLSISAQVEARCRDGTPSLVSWPQARAHEIPFHVVIEGRALLEDRAGGTVTALARGDIVLLPRGAAHVLHDGSGRVPASVDQHQSSAGWTRKENGGDGEPLDMLCGRFFIGPPHDRLIRDYLPTALVVRALPAGDNAGSASASAQLASLVALMRIESAGDKPGAQAVLNALAAALFALTLRAASEAAQAPQGWLALGGHPRLAPAISAMFAAPERPWDLPALAQLCNMSRATFTRHFQDKLGRSAIAMLTDIRMSIAANELKKPMMTTEAVADAVGYRSSAAFRRAFADKIGMTPGQWRRLVHQDE